MLMQAHMHTVRVPTVSKPVTKYSQEPTTASLPDPKTREPSTLLLVQFMTCRSSVHVRPAKLQVAVHWLIFTPGNTNLHVDL